MTGDGLARAILVVAVVISATTIVAVLLALVGHWSSAPILIIVDALAVTAWVARLRSRR